MADKKSDTVTGDAADEVLRGGSAPRRSDKRPSRAGAREDKPQGGGAHMRSLSQEEREGLDQQQRLHLLEVELRAAQDARRALEARLERLENAGPGGHVDVAAPLATLGESMQDVLDRVEQLEKRTHGPTSEALGLRLGRVDKAQEAFAQDLNEIALSLRALKDAGAGEHSDERSAAREAARVLRAQVDDLTRRVSELAQKPRRTFGFRTRLDFLFM